ncbi:MarR family transcriptional regulator [Fervidibacillus albus]
MSKFEQCTGISRTRLEILRTLSKGDNFSQRELQNKVNIDPAAITRHLKQLEEQGMIVRRKNPDDNRFSLVHLTEKGKRGIGTFCEEKERVTADILNGFSDQEKKLLLCMLKRLLENVNQING